MKRDVISYAIFGDLADGLASQLRPTIDTQALGPKADEAADTGSARAKERARQKRQANAVTTSELRRRVGLPKKTRQQKRAEERRAAKSRKGQDR